MFQEKQTPRTYNYNVKNTCFSFEFVAWSTLRRCFELLIDCFDFYAISLLILSYYGRYYSFLHLRIMFILMMIFGKRGRYFSLSLCTHLFRRCSFSVFSFLRSSFNFRSISSLFLRISCWFVAESQSCCSKTRISFFIFWMVTMCSSTVLKWIVDVVSIMTENHDTQRGRPS